jgi:hypothetical protein
MRGISCQAEDLLASLEGLPSMELGNYLNRLIAYQFVLLFTRVMIKMSTSSDHLARFL